MSKYDPKPLIEYHYHIQDLIDKQEKRAQDRIYHREKEKDRSERESLIADTKTVQVMDFWCNECKEDFKSVAIKQIEDDWSNRNQRIAFYKTKCFHGHWCMRLITDKEKDAYWARSLNVARDRSKHHNDIIQPFEEGFNMLFGKK